jgi:menaquinone-dependent protoporphyrinogen oxidase
MSEKGSAGRPRVLVTFATMYGQTEKIARALARHFGERGIDVIVRSCDEVAADSAFDGYDAVVAGAPVIREGLHRSMRRFVAEHVGELNATRSAFYQVSGAAGSKLESEREAARSIMNRFLEEAGWSPTERASFAGAIPYTKYPFWLKWVMKWISWRNGGSTDTSRDHEYTDWERVAAFGDTLADRVLASEGASKRAV